MKRRLKYTRFAEVALLLALVRPGAAQESSLPEMPPGALVRAAVRNEVAAAETAPVKHMFRSRRQTAKGSQTRLYVETSDAMAGMLVAINDQPLTPLEQQSEINHLMWLAANPDQLRKKRAREKEDADRSLRIVKALPDAFRYRYAGAESSEAGLGRASLGRQGAQLARLTFTPNPSYAPPSRVEQVLTGVEGYLLIDTTTRRIARIDGTLFKEVSFGWGLIGHLDKGGHFLVQQADLGDGSWDITEMSLNITGRILLFKGLNMVYDEVASDYRRVPDNLTFVEAVQMLKEQEKLAHGDLMPGPSETKKLLP